MSTRRNATLIAGQNLMTMALAKNAWDEGTEIPEFADTWDRHGYYKFTGKGGYPGDVFDALAGYSPDQSKFPFLTSSNKTRWYMDMPGQEAMAPWENNPLATYTVKYGCSMHADDDGGGYTVRAKVVKDASAYWNSMIALSPCPNSLHFYFATWTGTGKFKVVNESAIAGTYHYENAYGVQEYTVGPTADYFTVAVYEISGGQATRVLYETAVNKKTNGYFETRPNVWYYIAISSEGINLILGHDGEAYVGKEKYTPINAWLEKVVDEEDTT